jgi:hypothetical protein
MYSRKQIPVQYLWDFAGYIAISNIISVSEQWNTFYHKASSVYMLRKIVPDICLICKGRAN